MLTGWTEPLPIRDDHEGGPQTGCVVAAVTGIAQQDLEQMQTDGNNRNKNKKRGGYNYLKFFNHKSEVKSEKLAQSVGLH